MKSTKPLSRTGKPKGATKPETAAVTRPADSMLKAELERIRAEGIAAVDSMRRKAAEAGLDKMTMEEIDEIIAEVRRSRKR